MIHIAPAVAIVLFGLALIYRDGALVIVAAIAAVLSIIFDAAARHLGRGGAQICARLAAPLSRLDPLSPAERFIDRSQLLMIWLRYASPHFREPARRGSKHAYPSIRRRHCARHCRRRAFRLRRNDQHHRLALPGDASAAGPDLLRRSRRRHGRTTAASSSSATPGIVAQQLQARGYTAGGQSRRART